MGFGNTAVNDYKIAGNNNGQTVTFTAVREAGSTNYTVTRAVGLDLTHQEIVKGGGLFQVGDKRWMLGANQITNTAHAPRQGDKITDAGGVVWYLVGDATLDGLGIAWTCITRKAK